MTIVLLLVGLGLIVLGADWLVEGASSIARKAGVSEFVIGLTIVGFGTSCPELVVSLTGAFAGNADIAVGNVIGSNIFNVLFILGLTALFRPVSMTRENRKNDIPLTLIVTSTVPGIRPEPYLVGDRGRKRPATLGGSGIPSLFFGVSSPLFP
jgi:Ca2+/Na+ antiporter